jgi:polysaccharide export outer membrane protein
MLYALSALLIVGLWCSASLAEEKKADDSAVQERAAEKPDPAYIISAGDALDISVWKEEALTKVVIVLPDGRISFPLIGELTAAGKTVSQIKEELKEKLAPYVTVPIVSVEVKQTGSMLIYVIGRVNSPGRFVVNTNINVLQALATAGGLNPFAKRKKIKIMRAEGETTKTFFFNYDEIADGKRMEQNIWLQKGDVIVVP